MSEIPRKTKGLVFLRDQGQCVRCGGEGELNFHHRKLRSQSSKATVHNPENIILLCGSGTTGCHGWVHANPSTAYLMGWLVPAWADPLDVPCFVLTEDEFYRLDADASRTITQKAA
jgi:5-methylcytosine-specific restriction endonuclease McrA